jgi:hypothetical protein
MRAVDAPAFVRQVGFVSEHVDDDLLVLDLDRDRYYQLEGAASALWPLLDQPRTQAELADVLVATFDIDLVAARSDVSHWTEEMLRLGLIRRAK